MALWRGNFLGEAKGFDIVLRPLRALLTLIVISIPIIVLFPVIIPLFFFLRPVAPVAWSRITTSRKILSHEGNFTSLESLMM